MIKNSFKKYTIAGEENPNWVIAEPILLKIWADGILKASLRRLQYIQILSWIVSVIFFLGGFALRLSLVGLILLGGYWLFPQTFLMALDLVFSSVEIGGVEYARFSKSYLWLYELLGYVIVIKAVIFLLGGGFVTFVKDSCLYFLLILTNMFPLKIIAKGLQRGDYFAQLIAKTSFMGMNMAQSIRAAPLNERSQWDRVLGLYENSNNPLAREELEKLAEEFSGTSSKF